MLSGTELKEKLKAMGADLVGVVKTKDIEDLPTIPENLFDPFKSAVSIAVNQNILLIDEVLAVGDAAFRAKCYRRLSELMDAPGQKTVADHWEFQRDTVDVCPLFWTSA